MSEHAPPTNDPSRSDGRLRRSVDRPRPATRLVGGLRPVRRGGGRWSKKLLTVLWTRTTDREPPTNPADPDTGWGEALSWVVAISIGGAVARVVAQRAAATGWDRAMGSPPPTKDSAPAKNS